MSRKGRPLTPDELLISNRLYDMANRNYDRVTSRDGINDQFRDLMRALAPGLIKENCYTVGWYASKAYEHDIDPKKIEAVIVLFLT